MPVELKRIYRDLWWGVQYFKGGKGIMLFGGMGFQKATSTTHQDDVLYRYWIGEERNE